MMTSTHRHTYKEKKVSSALSNWVDISCANSVPRMEQRQQLTNKLPVKCFTFGFAHLFLGYLPHTHTHTHTHTLVCHAKQLAARNRTGFFFNSLIALVTIVVTVVWLSSHPLVLRVVYIARKSVTHTHTHT